MERHTRWEELGIEINDIYAQYKIAIWQTGPFKHKFIPLFSVHFPHGCLQSEQ